MNMTREQAAQKYGDNKVMTIPKCVADALINNKMDSVFSIHAINSALKPAYRKDAEFDPNNPQVIPYVILCGANFDSEDEDDLFVFTTHRIGGDSRLVGKYSIGTGGHIEDGEKIGDAIVRELSEEVGLSVDDVIDLDGNYAQFSHPNTADMMLIYDEASEVNSVHIGLIFVGIAENMNMVKVAEPDKLEGEWLPLERIIELDKSGLLEDWSSITLNRIFQTNEVYA